MVTHSPNPVFHLALGRPLLGPILEPHYLNCVLNILSIIQKPKSSKAAKYYLFFGGCALGKRAQLGRVGAQVG